MARLRMTQGLATFINNHNHAPSWLLPVHAHPLGTGLLSSMRLYGADAQQDDSKEPMSQKIRFVDKLRVEVSGGRGGAGVVAFSPRPGGRLVAAGGSGGNGGDVYLRATRRILSLGAVARVITAEAGGRGGSNERSGATGTTRIVDVPVGTIVKLIEDRSAAVAAAADADAEDELWGSDEDSNDADAEDEEHEEAAAQSSDDAIRMRHQGPDDGHQDDLWLQRQMAAHSRRHQRQLPERSSPLLQHGQHASAPQQVQQQDGAAADAGDATADVPSRGRRRRQLLPASKAASASAPAPASAADSAITEAAGAAEGSDGIRQSAPLQPVPQGSDAADSDAEEDAEAARQARQERWRHQAAQAVLLAEMMQEGQMLQVASGGIGGLGNMQIRGRQFHGPSKQASKGRPGSACLLLLECKTIADVGFVGLPNAGKSTLLSAMSAARAKIGSYEFTTLRPQLGALVYEDGCRLTLADIPGLIQGAHADKGRGNEFLKHIERTRVLAYVIDLSGGPHSLVTLTPAQQLAVLQNELHRYQPSLISSPSVVVANKVDSCTDAAAALAELKKHTAHPIVPVSAAHSVGLQRLKQALRMMAPPELQV